ncbi:MAG: hypothetical protein SH859_08960 [Hyphomicrobium aestuarii]|mgnify:CR=1 FL=1|nr:hypothetical protein [Hyphomicrobium aestuarii]
MTFAAIDRSVFFGGVAAVAVGCVAVLGAAPVAAQDISDKSLEKLTEYAWSLVPQQFTMPDGKTILVDKKKKTEIIVPPDVAREVIKVGYRSAHAQICELQTDQIDNYNSLMRREIDKKKWNDQQLLYISQLHLTTLMFMTGKVNVVEREGGKEVILEELKAKHQTCPPDQKVKVKQLITAYVAAGPKITPATIVSAPPAATGSTTPAAALPAAAPVPAAKPAVKPAAEKK